MVGKNKYIMDDFGQRWVRMGKERVRDGLGVGEAWARGLLSMSCNRAAVVAHGRLEGMRGMGFRIGCGWQEGSRGERRGERLLVRRHLNSEIVMLRGE